MFLFTALVLLLKFNALVVLLFTGLLFTAFTACFHFKVTLMQIRTASMSAMLAITKHGLCVCVLAPCLINFIMADMEVVRICISAWQGVIVRVSMVILWAFNFT